MVARRVPGLVAEAYAEEERAAVYRRQRLKSFEARIASGGWTKVPGLRMWRGLCLVCRDKTAQYDPTSCDYLCGCGCVRAAWAVEEEAAAKHGLERLRQVREGDDWRVAQALGLARTFPEYREGADHATACCPFHDDQRASFSINLESALWQCHGCGAKGNALILLRTAKVFARRAAR